MRLPISLVSFIIIGTVFLAAPLSACSSRAGVQGSLLPELRWEPDDDVRLSYGILLLDQALRDSDVSATLEAIRTLADISPSSRPFVEAAAWLLLNRSPALTREVLEPALRRFPDDINPHLLVAESWLEDKNPDQATKSIREYSASHPDSIQAKQELAIVYTKAEHYREAVETFALLPAKAFTPFVRYCHAKALAGVDRQEDAIRELRKAVEEMPEFIEAWGDLAKIYEKRGEYKQAAAVYEHVLEQEPASHTAWLRLIAVYLDAGDRQAALDVAKTAESDGLLFAAVPLFLERKIYPEADILLEQLHKKPNVPNEIYFYLAVAAYEGHKDISGALNWLSKMTIKNRFYERSLRLRPQLLYENKQTTQALDALHEAQKLFPDEITLFLSETHILNQEKRYTEALAILDNAIAKQPENLDLHYSRGMTLDAIGRKDEAMAIMERLAKENPDYYQALNYIGYSLAEQRRELPRALELLVKADQLSPNTAHIIDSLAWAQFQIGQLDAAWKSIQRAVQLEGGNDPVIWEHYGDIAAAQGKHEESRQAYTKALDVGHDKPEAIRSKMGKP